MKLIPLDKIQWIVIDMSKNPFFDGWGNGYVIIPNNHPWYKKDEDYINYDINERLNIYIHGGITFSRLIEHGGKNDLYKPYIGKWLVGFDTNHGYEDKNTWGKERVIEEAKRLAKAAVDILKI